MSSLILRTAARFLIPLLVLFSFYTLFRGHNQPGGGFAGGLLAATAFALYIFAWDAAAARRALVVDPCVLIGTGLMLALVAGLLPMVGGREFLTGIWAKLPLSEQSGFAVGTPVLFDVGVYLVIVGSSLLIITSLTGEEEERH
ncbi:MAG TPA: Na+/H+ antiporter subunit B [Thermoanaerobaculia bacterium]|nr:Na+/H+ antiporter subunit B [Thermoanaerobaculia bacterium]